MTQTTYSHSTLSEYDSIPISILWDDPSAPGIISWTPGEGRIVVKPIPGSSKNDIYMMGFGPKTLEIPLILLQEDYQDFLDARQGEGDLLIPGTMADGSGTDYIIQGEVYHRYTCSLVDVKDPVFVTDDGTVELVASFVRTDNAS